MSRLGTKLIPMETHEALARQIADEVRAAMARAGISQRDLADRTGLPLVTLSRRLTGKGKPFDVGELALIADVLGLSLVELAIRAERASARANAA